MVSQPGIQIHSIQAAVLRTKGGPLRIESLTLEGPRDDEILVRIVASGICHTDIDMCDSWDDADGPVVLGHEGAGVVESVGKRVRSVKRGDHVVLSYQSCGCCRQCLSGPPTRCERFYEANFGFQFYEFSAINEAIADAVRGDTIKPVLRIGEGGVVERAGGRPKAFYMFSEGSI